MDIQTFLSVLQGKIDAKIQELEFLEAEYEIAESEFNKAGNRPTQQQYDAFVDARENLEAYQFNGE